MGKMIKQIFGVCLVSIIVVQAATMAFGSCSYQVSHSKSRWLGPDPIVMNTQEQLQQAFEELREGHVSKHNPTG